MDWNFQDPPVGVMDGIVGGSSSRRQLAVRAVEEVEAATTGRQDDIPDLRRQVDPAALGASFRQDGQAAHVELDARQGGTAARQFFEDPARR